MCVTLSPANISNTILYGAEIELKHGIQHVLGYQNNPVNLAPGPNAMILPFPANNLMGKENIIDTSEHKNILNNIADSITNPYLSNTKSIQLNSGSRSVQVFDSGIYTIILAQNAADIPSALSKVPVEKRPALNKGIFDAYAKWYPDWQVALCCFNNKDDTSTALINDRPIANVFNKRKVEPLLWWYTPMDKSHLFLPMLDAHDGNVPDLKSKVKRDHTIAIGSFRHKAKYKVEYSHLLYSKTIPIGFEPPEDDISKYLTKTVNGSILDGFYTKNGDFKVKISDGMNLGRITNLETLPPGYSA